MIKQISAAFLFTFLAFTASAQIPTAYTGLGVGGWLGYAWASPDGNRIMMTIGDNAQGSFVIWNIAEGEMPFIDKEFRQDVDYWSPSGRYALTPGGNGGRDPQNNKRDYYLHLKIDTAKTRTVQKGPHYFETELIRNETAYADDYVFGVTDKGWLITTKASKRDKRWTTREVYNKYEGIRICHPQIRDSFIVVTEDMVKQKTDHSSAETVISDDGSTIYTYSHVYGEDFATVQCWPLEANAKQRSFRTRMSLIYPGWWSDQLAILPNSNTNYFETYDTRNGTLLAADSNLTSYRRPLFLRHGRIFRYDGRRYMMEELAPVDGHLKTISAVPLDTTGFHLSPNMPYHALLLTDEKWILLPAGNNKWGEKQVADIKSGLGNNAILADLKTGKPLAMYKGFFSGDLSQYISNTELVREEAVKKSLAWGTAAGRTETNGRPEFFIPGEYIGKFTSLNQDKHFSIYDKWFYVLNANASDNTYNLLYIDGKHTGIRTHVSVAEVSQYERGIPTFYLCSHCFGRGREIVKEITHAYDAWIDQNGKVTYTRNEKGDTYKEVDTFCKHCNGAGWTKEP